MTDPVCADNFGDIRFVNSAPDSAYVTRPIPESVTQAMNRAPMGAMDEIVYAALGSRLKTVMDPSCAIHEALCRSLVHTAVNFRSLNPTFLAGRQPAVPADSGSAYQSRLWGPNRDGRLPQTSPLTTASATYAAGQDPGTEQNKGVLVAKLFADLQNHLPCVLFNITNIDPQPLGIGGSAVTKKFYRDGQVVHEVGYRVVLSAEATVVTEDHEATSNLRAIVEATFGPLRDQVQTGASVVGQTWQLTLPTRVAPSAISDLDAPWAQGDDKGSKLYTATVGLENLTFECFAWLAKPVAKGIAAAPPEDATAPYIRLAVGDTTDDQPIRLRLGQKARLSIGGSSVRSDLALSQSKKVVELSYPWSGTGQYEIVGKRVGEAVLRLYDTGGVVSNSGYQTPTGIPKGVLVERKVVVSAV